MHGGLTVIFIENAVVDEAKVDDVDRDFRVKYLAELIPNSVIKAGIVWKVISCSSTCGFNLVDSKRICVIGRNPSQSGLSCYRK